MTFRDVEIAALSTGGRHPGAVPFPEVVTADSSDEDIDRWVR